MSEAVGPMLANDCTGEDQMKTHWLCWLIGHKCYVHAYHHKKVSICLRGDLVTIVNSEKEIVYDYDHR